MANRRKHDYPEWVEKYRGPGLTIKKIGKDKYALYSAKYQRSPEGGGNSVQKYLGRISKEFGFIPSNDPSRTVYLEYGLTHLIWTNLRVPLTKRLWQGARDHQLMKLGILKYVFGEINPDFIRASVLTYSEAEELIALSEQLKPKRIDTVATAVQKEMATALPDETERKIVEGLLRNCVLKMGDEKERPLLPERAVEILKKNNLKYE